MRGFLCKLTDKTLSLQRLTEIDPICTSGISLCKLGNQNSREKRFQIYKLTDCIWMLQWLRPNQLQGSFGFQSSKAPSTLIRFQTKTELFCSGYGYHPHYNAENNHRKRSYPKTLSRVERFENDAFWKRCFLVWTEKTMLSENGDIINRHDRPPDHSTASNQNGFNFAPILRADILKCACVEFIWPCALRV